MTINEIQDEIIDDFSALDDWMDRYQLLIDLGEELEPLPEEDKTDQNLIDGCQSRVWIVCEEHDGLLDFRAESDALIVKGIVSLVLRAVTHQTPAKFWIPNFTSFSALASPSTCRPPAQTAFWP